MLLIVCHTLNLNLTEQSYSESVQVNIKSENRDSLLIGGIYRSPQSSDEKKIDCCLIC